MNKLLTSIAALPLIVTLGCGPDTDPPSEDVTLTMTIFASDPSEVDEVITSTYDSNGNLKAFSQGACGEAICQTSVDFILDSKGNPTKMTWVSGGPEEIYQFNNTYSGNQLITREGPCQVNQGTMFCFGTVTFTYNGDGSIATKDFVSSYFTPSTTTYNYASPGQLGTYTVEQDVGNGGPEVVESREFLYRIDGNLEYYNTQEETVDTATTYFYNGADLIGKDYTYDTDPPYSETYTIVNGLLETTCFDGTDCMDISYDAAGIPTAVHQDGILIGTFDYEGDPAVYASIKAALKAKSVEVAVPFIDELFVNEFPNLIGEALQSYLP